MTFETFRYFAASKHGQVHTNLLDGDPGLSDVFGAAEERVGKGDAGRSDVSHHLLFRRESRRMGTRWSTAGDLQARVSKVP